MFKPALILSLVLFNGPNNANNGPLSTGRIDYQITDVSWRVVNDSVMGGRSRGTLDVASNKLTFTGFTNTNGGGFSSIRTAPQQMNLNGYSRLVMRVRGDGRTYTFRLSSNKTRISYWSNFRTQTNTWQEIELPFASFWPNWRGRKQNAPPISSPDITALGIMIYDGQNGPFRIEVDWIKAK